MLCAFSFRNNYTELCAGDWVGVGVHEGVRWMEEDNTYTPTHTLNIEIAITVRILHTYLHTLNNW